jgi:hypothetical protein
MTATAAQAGAESQPPTPPNLRTGVRLKTAAATKSQAGAKA